MVIFKGKIYIISDMYPSNVLFMPPDENDMHASDLNMSDLPLGCR